MTASTPSHHEMTEWMIPSPGFIKINCDTANGDAGCMVGCIGRDIDNNVVALQAWSRDFTDLLMAETFALKCAIQLAKLKKWKQVIVESDCKVLIDHLNREYQGEHFWNIKEMILWIKKEAEQEGSWFLNRVDRMANYLAHNLAKLALRISRRGNIPLRQVPETVQLDSVAFT